MLHCLHDSHKINFSRLFIIQASVLCQYRITKVFSVGYNIPHPFCIIDYKKKTEIIPPLLLYVFCYYRSNRRYKVAFNSFIIYFE